MTFSKTKRTKENFHWNSAPGSRNPQNSYASALPSFPIPIQWQALRTILWWCKIRNIIHKEGNSDKRKKEQPQRKSFENRDVKMVKGACHPSPPTSSSFCYVLSASGNGHILKIYSQYDTFIHNINIIIVYVFFIWNASRP